MSFEPISVVGLITDRVGTPRNDGTPGSGLYEVPLQLSASPSPGWSKVFVATFDRPPSWTSMHRPGIAQVTGDVIWLRGTTLEELEKYHLKTVKLAVQAANEAEVMRLEKLETDLERARAQEEEHRRHAEDVAERLDFDS